MKNRSSEVALSYCGTLVKQVDFDRFLLSLFLSADVREDVWAVLAFNHEISKTREVVSESTLGLIRLQWWRDAIKGIYEEGEIVEHEVVKPLSEAIKRHDLPREAFDKLAYAREFDLEDVMPANLEGLMNYADFTTSPLIELILKISGDAPNAHVVQPIGINYALAGLLRAMPYFIKEHRFLLPEDLFNKHQLDKNTIFEEEGRDKLSGLVKDICDQRLPLTKPSHSFLKGSEALSEMYFRQIKSLDYNVFDARLQNPPPFKALRLYVRVKVL